MRQDDGVMLFAYLCLEQIGFMGKTLASSCWRAHCFWGFGVAAPSTPPQG
jgi:hypothetical protein